MDDEEEPVYKETEEVLKGVEGTNNLILIGDWNDVVREKEEGSIVGKYGLAKRNERGGRFVEFCAKHKLVIANTLFKNHKRRIYEVCPESIGPTFISPR